ncbi:MAG TPA: hypothetical protein VF984_09705 [Actinomycetota bacterium]
MTWDLLVVGGIVAAVAAAVLGGLFSPTKLLLALLGMGAAALVAIVAIVALSSTTPSPPMGDFSHAQLEADRLMTQEMASVVGPGMDAQMTTNGMLARSANDAYLRALEEHIRQVDRMVGLVP